MDGSEVVHAALGSLYLSMDRSEDFSEVGRELGKEILCLLSFLYYLWKIFSQLLRLQATEGRIGFHPCHKSLKLAHLCFADGLFIYRLL